MHIERTGCFALPLSPEAAFPLFSPEGERRWVAGWEPVALHAPQGELAQAGAVFTTAVGGELTLWLVLELDRARRAARYARITPGSRLGTVDVRCRASDRDPGATEVDVTYALTSLSPEGEAVLAALTPDAFGAMLESWNRLIRATL